MAARTRARLATSALLILPSLAAWSAASGSLQMNVTPSRITTDPGQELNPSLSPDGKSIAYDRETAPGNSDVYVVKPGQAPVNLTADSPANDGHPAFSPDGTLIAFSSARDGGGIYVMSVSGGPAKRLADGGFNPSWSPDGKQVVYATASTGSPYGAPVASVVWAVTVDSGQKRQVSKGYAVHPRYSPHGQRIAFWSLERDGKYGTQRDIWTMKPDGSDLVSITNDAAVDWTPAWSPDGKYLYFASDRDGSMKIWGVAIDENTGKATSEAELVTKDGGAQVRGQISISKDGRLAYIDRSVTRSFYKIAFDPATGKTQGQATPITVSSTSPTAFSVSPDGQWIAFVTGDNNQEDVYVVKTDGTGLRRLTNDSYRDRSPQWTPDSRKISFRSDRPTDRPMGNYQWYVINPDGTGLQRLSSTPGSNAAAIDWSPDGKKVVIAPNFSTGGYELLLMNSDGSDVQKIASTPDTFGNVVWAPDSKRFVYRESKGSTGRAFMYAAGAPKPEPLPEENFAPVSWSLDGKTIAGNKVVSGRPSLTMVYDVAGKKYEELTAIGGGPQLLRDGLQMLIGRDGNRIQIVNRSTRTIQDVMSVTPPSTLGFGVTSDNKTIFYLLNRVEADVYTIGR